MVPADEAPADNDSLRVEVSAGVGWLIFNRPASGNAINAAMFQALPQVWRRLDADPDVRAIVVTGSGKHFHTGLDMGALARQPDSLRRATRQTREARLEITGWHLGVRTPVVAAVNGTCAGGGLHFVVDADVVIASSNARFIDPHVSVGQASAWEAVGLTRRIPATVASRLALIGRHEYLSADRARQVGLVSEVVDPAELHARAQWIAECIAAQDPRMAAAIKAAMWAGQEIGRSAAMRAAAAALHD
ncbi:enoyl-CoA hydratase/isomerase family protein [Mycobacterium sp. 94-17]|uniref:enoyl-CoA hydratase/isomerase family protein n=1 Tax=Mycobacterium sp. 94-17 TaxID=2986147 RepID=UPI002D1EA707|nr:enoyl-CoA hydratase/isomerase family protein [Mycobacterium sp. 94-17]MEB4209766.1 enoyl-CoA hydratase/isomerase family protein [Mycobacterium sp. 94-17]